MCNTSANTPIQAEFLPSSLLGVQAIRISSKRSFGKHWHSTFGFGVMEQGGHRSASGRGQVEVLAGSVLTHNPGEVHDGVALQGERRCWVMLHVDVHLMHSLGGQIGVSSNSDVEFTHPVLQDPQLVVQLQRLLKFWAQRDVRELDDGLTRLADESALSLLCTRMLTQHSTARLPVKAPASMVNARDMLAAEAVNPPSLQALAEPLGLSRYQLLRRFTEVYGLPPHAWLRSYRLERARALMAKGTPLAAIAAECGFADQSHMTRAFRSLLGHSPGSIQLVLQPRSRRSH
jgi:AraC-like DNA-binding protein